jgi:hypothetical protein
MIRAETVVPAAPEEVWALVNDPARLPQWWPGVTRVEEASDEAWTTVLSSPKGKSVRVDYSLLAQRGRLTDTVPTLYIRQRGELDAGTDGETVPVVGLFGSEDGNAGHGLFAIGGASSRRGSACATKNWLGPGHSQ